MKISIGAIALIVSALIQNALMITSPDTLQRAVALGTLQLGTWITAAAFLIAGNIADRSK